MPVCSKKPWSPAATKRERTVCGLCGSGTQVAPPEEMNSPDLVRRRRLDDPRRAAADSRAASDRRWLVVELRGRIAGGGSRRRRAGPCANPSEETSGTVVAASRTFLPLDLPTVGTAGQPSSGAVSHHPPSLAEATARRSMDTTSARLVPLCPGMLGGHRRRRRAIYRTDRCGSAIGLVPARARRHSDRRVGEPAGDARQRRAGFRRRAHDGGPSGLPARRECDHAHARQPRASKRSAVGRVRT